MKWAKLLHLDALLVLTIIKKFILLRDMKEKVKIIMYYHYIHTICMYVCMYALVKFYYCHSTVLSAFHRWNKTVV